MAPTGEGVGEALVVTDFGVDLDGFVGPTGSRWS